MKVTLADPARNHSHTIEVPSPWPDLDSAVTRYQEVQQKLNEAYANIEATRTAVTAARRERQDRLATAVLDGGRQPQKDEVAVAEQKHTAAAALYDATAQALTMAFDRIEQLIEANRGDWLGAASLAEADATATYGTAVEAIATAREQMMVARTHSAFIRGFPQRKAGWIPDPTEVTIAGAKLPWQSVVTSLKREAGTASPEPRTLPQHVEALKQVAKQTADPKVAA